MDKKNLEGKVDKVTGKVKEIGGVATDNRDWETEGKLDQIKGKVLGHLAGGVHRDRRDFFNVYYGVGSFPQFHGAFRRPQ